MKTTSLFIISFYLTISLFAQSGPTEPVQLNRTFLVNSAGLPEEFLLFTPDSAVQILFNPARATTYSKGFIYVNYLSDFTSWNYLRGKFPSLYTENYNNSKNPSVSLASLFSVGKAKWLLEFTNGINRYNNSQNIVDSENRIYDPVFKYDLNSSASMNNYSTDGSITSLKLSRIFKSGETNLSIGIFGIIYTNNTNSSEINDNSDFYYHQIQADSLIYKFSSNSSYGSSTNFKDKKYAIGFEITANNDNWDYIGSLDYQFNDNSGKRLAYEMTFNTDSTYSPTNNWNFYTNLLSRDIDNFSDQKPSIINLNNYFRHSIDWLTENDNIFLSLNAFYSYGTLSYNNIYHSRTQFTSNQVANADTEETKYTDKFDTKNWGINLSTGYVLSKRLTDIDVLTGIKFLTKIENLKFINESYNYPRYVFETIRLKPKFVTFTLPLYINYTPYQWISVYGGINYSYVYISNKSSQESSGITLLSYYTTELIVSDKENFLNEGWQSYKSIYIGCELRHPSGLKIQFLFDKDIVTIPNWNVSLGYNF